MSFIRTEDKKKHHARKLPDGSFEFDGKKEEVGGGGGSVVTWTSATVSTPRKQIGAINIDGVETKVYAPNPSMPQTGIALCYPGQSISSPYAVTVLDGDLKRDKFCKCELEFVVPENANEKAFNVSLIDDDRNVVFKYYATEDKSVLKFTIIKNDSNYTIYGTETTQNYILMMMDQDTGETFVNANFDIGSTSASKAPCFKFIADADDETNYLVTVTVYKEITFVALTTADLGD